MPESEDSKHVTPNHPILLQARTSLGFHIFHENYDVLDLYLFRWIALDAKVVPEGANVVAAFDSPTLTNTIFPIFPLLLSSNCDLLAIWTSATVAPLKPMNCSLGAGRFEHRMDVNGKKPVAKFQSQMLNWRHGFKTSESSGALNFQIWKQKQQIHWW